jgi:polysaccharide export outer membrane protein
MRWTFRIGLALLAAVIAGAVARADDLPKYATMRGSGAWSPPDQTEAQQPRPQSPPQHPVQQRSPQAPLKIAAIQQTSLPASNGPTDYRLGTGDKVRVTVYGEDDLSGEFQVDSTGFLRLPMIGQVQAAGLNAQALEGSITAAYGQGYLLEPRVNVEVTTYRPFYIIGEVNKPGEYAYVNGMNVLNAVALAGGFTQKAADGHVYLRKNGTSKEIRVAADQTVQVMPGDIVRVGSSGLWDVLSIVGPLAPLAPRY